MKLLTLAVAVCGASVALAQDPLGDFRQPKLGEAKPFRIAVIRHADPYFVKAMLEGAYVPFPEWSTIPLQPPTGAGSPWLRGGRIVVNPTDNSLWWFPGTAPGAGNTGGAPGGAPGGGSGAAGNSGIPGLGG